MGSILDNTEAALMHVDTPSRSNDELKEILNAMDAVPKVLLLHRIVTLRCETLPGNKGSNLRSAT
jgi:hypothetical protein